MDRTNKTKPALSLNPQNQRKNLASSIYSSALGMGLGTLLSRILGLLRDALLASFFSKSALDCFAIGFRLPNFFRRLMGEGALSVSFIPHYLELKGESPEKAKALKDIMFSFLFLLSSLLSVGGILFLDQILHFIIYSGSSSLSQESFKAAVQMGRWMFAYLFLVTHFAYFMSVLNANKKFWVAGLAPAFFNLGFITFIFFPERFTFFSGQQLAWGVLFGGALQAGLVAWAYIKDFGGPKFNFKFCFKPFKRVLWATLPSLLGIGVLQIISIININFCSRVGEGANGFLYFADRIMELPQSLIAVSLGTAMLPSLSETWIKSREDFDSTLVSSLRIYLYFALPAGLGLFFLALPITQLLFERGLFSFEKALEVSRVVQVYSGLLIVSGLSRTLLPVYYSFKNTWYPACVALVVLSSHFFVGNHFVEIWGLRGVAATTLTSGLINFSLLLIGLKLFIKRSYLIDLCRATLQFLPPSLILATFLYFVQSHLPEGSQSFTKMILTVAAIASSVLIYYFISLVFKLEESRLIWALIRKIKR